MGRVTDRLTFANVISLLAMFIALGGGAYALTSQDKKQVKKIAKKQIKKAAPGLSVASATIADSAQTADTATNAEALGGKSLSAVLPTSASAQDPNVIPVPGGITGTVVVSTKIDTTARSRILAEATVELEGADAGEEAACLLELDGGTISRSYETTFDDIGTVNEATLGVVGAENEVATGEHTAALRCFTDVGTVTKDDAGINVIAIPVP